MSDTVPVMQPPQRILLATDLGSHSDRALDRAAQLARQWQAALHAVHALRPDVQTTWFPHTYGNATPSKDDVASVRHQIRRDMRGQVANPTIHVAVGEPERVILETAERENCELIILGANGPSYAAVTVGTTSARMLRQSRRSVLIVRNRPHDSYRRVLVGTDFTAESRHGLQTAAAWFTQTDLAVMHVLDIPYKSLLLDAGRCDELARMEHDTMAAFIAETQLPADIGQRVHGCVEYGYPEIELRDYGVANDTDLTVIGAVKHGMAFHMLVGSNAARIVQNVLSDILVVYDPTG